MFLTELKANKPILPIIPHNKNIEIKFAYNSQQALVKTLLNRILNE